MAKRKWKTINKVERKFSAVTLLTVLGILAVGFGLQARRTATPISESDFEARYGQNAPVFPADATAEELEALRFLYAYLPLNDLADYSPEFHLANVRASMKADREMPWAQSVPDREWRHFVLPERVNNENLDMSRLPSSTKNCATGSKGSPCQKPSSR